ncbi:hypothetical protein DFP97_11297 [Paenibacillus prosopidis]|uniref:Uncharacterized protein n=1 Tax=Paenibacillus prosopidis TaxID=630520 RepID=A0A368VRF8_9BACL|nr:hypothetical protein DFP97_11297 [Paenibacillus prosopidis]
MDFKKGDIVNDVEYGQGRICFIWLTGNVDIDFGDGKKLLNCPTKFLNKVSE